MVIHSDMIQICNGVAVGVLTRLGVVDRYFYVDGPHRHRQHQRKKSYCNRKHAGHLHSFSPCNVRNKRPHRIAHIDAVVKCDAVMSADLAATPVSALLKPFLDLVQLIQRNRKISNL